MRVVHVSKATGIAGSEKHLLSLLPGLAKRGVDVRMLVLEAPRHPATMFAEALSMRGVPVERVPLYAHLDPTAMLRLVRLLRALQPDIVHTHLIHGDLYGIWAATNAGVSCVISSRHNDDAFRHYALFRWLNHRLMQRVAHVVAISEALARFVIGVEGVPPEKVVTIHYGLEAPQLDDTARHRARDALGADPNSPLVGAVGRFVRQKGFDVLLNAFHQVLLTCPEARLIIVGDGPLRRSLTRQAIQLGIDHAVTFAGWHPDACVLMPALDVLAVPSRWEGFGLVTLEAMGCALPIVASRASALPEIVVDGETGLLVPTEDPGALAEALLTLLVNPGRAKTMGSAGYVRLRQVFSVERMVTTTLQQVYNL